MKLVLEVTYASNSSKDIHTDLEPNRALTGLNSFVHDLLNLDGQGVTSVTIRVQGTEEEEGTPERKVSHERRTYTD